jgi:serine/threonine protein kinase
LGSTSDIESDPLLGTFVGSYRLVRVLGAGGMGRVYAAVQPEVGARVAIKVIAEQYARSAELTERFFAEARAVNLIRHENIVSVYDLAQLPDGRPVIVMELVEGRTLREVLQAGPAPLGGVVTVMLDVLSALAAAHAVGIVHRDLKPDNIVVTPNGRAKVLDFGIAKLLTTSGAARSPRTRTGVILGTPEYMAPEQINGGLVDPCSDVYALGVLLFEAVTGQRPFDGKTDFEVMRAHVDQPPPSTRSLRPEVPPGIEAVIMCALAKRPAERFASATAMANALHAASEGLAPEQWRSLTPRAVQIARPLTPPQPPEVDPTDPHLVDPAMNRQTAPGTPRGRLDAPPTIVATPGGRRDGELAMNRETAEVQRGGLVVGGASLVTHVDKPTPARSDAANDRSTPERRDRDASDPPEHARDRASDLAGSHDRASELAIAARDRASDLAIGPRDRASNLAIDPRLPRASTMPAPPRSRSRQLMPLLAAAAGAGIVAVIFAMRGQEPPPPPLTATTTDDAAIARGGDLADSALEIIEAPPTPEEPVVAAARSDAGVPRLGADKSRPAGSSPIATTRGQPSVPVTVAASGTGSPASPMIMKPDYDPKQLDPSAYVARATAIARQIVPDAELTLINFAPVLSNGRVDLTLPGANTTFMFVSPANRNAKPVGVPANTPLTRNCFVMVKATATDVRAFSMPTDDCGNYMPMTKIECTTRDVWKRAIDMGQKADLSAELAMIQTPKGKHWSFTTGGSSESISIDDDCRTPKQPADVDPRGVFSATTAEPFDPIRYGATALQLARKLEPDAALSEIEVRPVARDGTLDLDLDDDDRSVVYRFQSAARAKDPLAVNKYSGKRPVRWCEVYVILSRSDGQFSVGRAEMTECKHVGGRLPRCTAKQLWAKVLAIAKTDPGPTAYMVFRPHMKGGEWEIATSGDADQNHRIYERGIADDCK